MTAKRLGWALLALATLLNLRLFLSRWSEEPRSHFEAIISDTELSSLALGFGAYVVLLVLIDTARSRRLGASLVLACACGLVGLSLSALGVLKSIQDPSANFFVTGAAAATTFTQFGAGMPDTRTSGHGLLLSFVLMTLTSLNVFFLFAPWTTHVPSYVQDALDNVPLSSFYFGSVHSDVSPVSIWLRWIINLFFPRPSINATALSSMLYAAVGLAMAGVSLEMVFGRPWGWALLVLAWTDRWLFAGAVSSAIISQPILSTGGVLLLCAWALWRQPSPLSWPEVLVLGAVNSGGLLYNLYGYSAARMTWLVGSGIAAVILLARRAVRFNLVGARKAGMALLPAAMILLAIWAFVFDMNTERFKAQILISPEPSRQIRDADSYHAPINRVHDPDIPIWWGTGIPTNGEAIVLYWRRTPQELYEKVQWLMHQLSLEPPISCVLVLLGGVGMAVSLASPVPLRRWFSACLIALGLTCFSTFLLAQDHSAYRRGLSTNLLLLCGVVAVFAVKCRRRLLKAWAFVLCVVLAVLKAPGELNALFDDSFWSPVCASCRPVFEVRNLVNDPAFSAVAKHPLRFVIRVGSPESLYMLCEKNTVNSAEFAELAPHSSAVSVAFGQLAESFRSLSHGEVMAVSCFESSLSDPELSALCQGASPFGKLLAIIPSDPQKRKPVWWAFVQRQ